jgi:hypothetical protein
MQLFFIWIISIMKYSSYECISINQKYELSSYKTRNQLIFFTPFDTKFNYTQTWIIPFLCIDNFMLLKFGLDYMSKFYFILSESGAIFVNHRQPIKTKKFHSGVPLYDS